MQPAAAGLISNWNGVDIVYHALVSTSTEDACVHTGVTGPLYNMHGDLVASGYNDLWKGSIQNPVLYDLNGNKVSSSNVVATGSGSPGWWVGSSFGDLDTTDVTGIVGDPTASDYAWVAYGSKLGSAHHSGSTASARRCPVRRRSEFTRTIP